MAQSPVKVSFGNKHFLRENMDNPEKMWQPLSIILMHMIKNILLKIKIRQNSSFFFRDLAPSASNECKSLF